MQPLTSTTLTLILSPLERVVIEKEESLVGLAVNGAPFKKK